MCDQEKEKCPVCGEPWVDTCLCAAHDSECANGHHWHHCPQHGTVVLGENDHRQGDRCTCGIGGPGPPDEEVSGCKEKRDKCKEPYITLRDEQEQENSVRDDPLRVRRPKRELPSTSEEIIQLQQQLRQERSRSPRWKEPSPPELDDVLELKLTFRDRGVILALIGRQIQATTGEVTYLKTASGVADAECFFPSRENLTELFCRLYFADRNFREVAFPATQTIADLADHYGIVKPRRKPGESHEEYWIRIHVEFKRKGMNVGSWDDSPGWEELVQEYIRAHPEVRDKIIASGWGEELGLEKGEKDDEGDTEEVSAVSTQSIGG